MADIQTQVGKTLLKSLVEMREQNNGDISLQDVGGMFMEIAGSLQPGDSPATKFMHEEIARMASYITDAKKEIFSISTNDDAEDVIVDASQHLDEVIKATEQATNTIMDAADKVQALAADAGEKGQEITDATMAIYDACAFQDITGQRINKVITLLENIEERIGNLNGLFGADDEEKAKLAEAASKRELTDEDLMNGPQLAADASSQDDIDALFDSIDTTAVQNNS